MDWFGNTGDLLAGAPINEQDVPKKRDCRGLSDSEFGLNFDICCLVNEIELISDMWPITY